LVLLNPLPTMIVFLLASVLTLHYVYLRKIQEGVVMG
jgi:hypothetical protein